MTSLECPMKILTTEQIREADAYTIKHEPVASVDLMERAAVACMQWITSAYREPIKMHVFCGLGNNGGDGLAIARLLAEKKYKIIVYIVRCSDKCSGDFKTNEQRLKGTGVTVLDIRSADDLKNIKAQSSDIVIDAIFGSGLNKPVEGLAADVIKYINALKLPVIAIDVPSGLPLSAKEKPDAWVCINSTHTLTFQAPKLVFMFPQAGKHIGDFTILDIGLDASFINKQETINYFITLSDVQAILKPRKKFSHKGTYGHALIISGSYGKIGAAVLAANACLRSGAGLVTVHIPKCGYEIIQTALPEVMVSVDSTDHYISELPKLEKYNAIGVGPGLDNEKQTQNTLKLLIQNAVVPLVLDADAINILSMNKTWLPFLPKNSILTPHPKEFERLVGKTDSDYARYDQLREFAFKYGVYVVLKGAHTAVACPDATVYFNSTGNPGMATGGSGDVLTGIITGLLAQGYAPKEAAVFGVYWHGLAGDISMDRSGTSCIIAGDIIEALSFAYKAIVK